MNKQRGGSLIELMVVISIITLAMVGSLSAIEGVRVDARDAQRVKSAQQIMRALRDYSLDNNDRLPTVQYPAQYLGNSGAASGNWDVSGPQWLDNPERFLSFLTDGGYLDPKVLEIFYNHDYFLRYYCYPGSGLNLHYRREYDNRFVVASFNYQDTSTSSVPFWRNPDWTCGL